MTGSGRAGGVGGREALGLVADPGAPRAPEVFRHGTLLVKVYAPRGTDPQQPHARDEVYVILSGSAAFFDGADRRAVSPGDFLFVAAGREHRFEELSGDFATWVLYYGPEGGEPDGAAPDG